MEPLSPSALVLALLLLVSVTGVLLILLVAHGILQIEARPNLASQQTAPTEIHYGRGPSRRCSATRSVCVIKVVHRVAHFITSLVGRVLDDVTDALDIFTSAFNRVAGGKRGAKEGHTGE